MFFYWLWIKRVLFSPRTVFQFSSLFSLFGLILAVAALTVALLAFNGVSQSLEQILISRQGHLRIQSATPLPAEKILEDMSSFQEFFSDETVFFSFEALILNEGHFKGVFFEALPREKLQSLSFLKKGILEGDFNSYKDFVILGSHLAEELQASPGSLVSVIVSSKRESGFLRKQAHLKVGAIVDFGQYDFNSSLAFMPLSAAKALGQAEVSGLNIWLKEPKQIPFLKQEIGEAFEESYVIQSWKDRDKNFFAVIESDKKIIFFVLLILIISAGFNVSSSLFVQVFRKTKDISILKAMGAKKQWIRNLFLLNGLVLGFFGTSIGILLGLCFCYVLSFIQSRFAIIPSEVYQVSEILWDWKSRDLLLIFIVSLLVVVLSSILPASRAYKRSIKSGLAYD